MRPGNKASPRRTLAVCGTAHFLHDGFSDVLFLLLPVWQAEFGLSLAQVGLLKTAYSGALAGFQVPAGVLAERRGERGLLVLGTAATALGFLALGLAGGFAALAVILFLAGCGSSVQHPLSSSLVSRGWEPGRRRAALGIYNFTGDLGKVAVPAAAALGVALVGWRWTTTGYAVLALLAAPALFLLLGRFAPAEKRGPPASAAAPAGRGGSRWGIRDRRGFQALSAIGVIDGGTRTGFLTFLPFLLIAKGAAVESVGLALALTFAGGAVGKFACGVLAGRVGVIRTTVLTELATAGGILLLLVLPLGACFAVLPFIGVALNGTSSVLYGTVADLVTAERRSRAFGLFYTLGTGSGALAPTLYGLLSDAVGVPTTLAVVAAVVLVAVPLAWLLRPALLAAAPESPA